MELRAIFPGGRVLAGVAVTVLSTACRPSTPPARSAPPPQVVQLNQGWSDREAEFYNHANEGTNLAPLDFLLNLPDPANRGSKFVDKLTTEYGFIPSAAAASNPHGLPVGFAIDDRPAKFGDRVYAGITCSACHTRQLTYSTRGANGESASWILAVHGGPALVDIPRFNRDLYDAFFALLEDDGLGQQFAQGVLGKSPTAEELAALRAEVREFSEPVSVTRSILAKANIPAADFGPGNLNALSQGNYNNLGLVAWLAKKGVPPPPSSGPVPLPRFEGSVNLPPMWFAPTDTWAQWFAEIHDPGPRNWIQSVSTSEVRPPKMVAALKKQVMLASIDFDNIAEIQRSLELLRTPKWPEQVFGHLDRAKVEEGRGLYGQHCAECHTRAVLPPNSLGIVFKERPAFDVGTDATAYQQFAQDVALRVQGLERISTEIVAFRTAQLGLQPGAQVADYMKLYSRGRPNEYRLASDNYGDKQEADWPRTGAAYWASPLEGIFASGPYFHNGSIRTLREVMTPPEQRPKTFRTGSSEFDAAGVGLRDDGRFVYDTAEPGKGSGGHAFGTDLPQDQKDALIEYLKSL